MTKDELTEVLRLHGMWLHDKPGGKRVDLIGANLRWADLTGAVLTGAVLRWADLAGAVLTGAVLTRADLTGADLTEADLTRADLTGANLQWADLTEAVLTRADLTGANLRWAVLIRADLTGTCLSGDIPTPSVDAVLASGMNIQDGWVYGWRIKTSQHCGSTTYEPGQTYTAILSRDTSTECHPGIYLAGKAWLDSQYRDAPQVRCRCRLDHLVHAGNKWRTDSLEVLEDA